MAAFVLVLAFAALAVAVPARDGLRDRLLRALVVSGVLVVAITELLGAFDALRQTPLLIGWGAVAVAAGAYGWRRLSVPRIPPSARDPIVLLSAAGIAAIVSLTGVTAAFSPPNSTDAMAYHLPRVVYWAEQASVRFFPTPYLNQIMLQPLTEYFMLHTYVLSGGDRLVNFVPWLASLFSIIGVSAVAREFGGGPRGQALAALFCATLPSGVLASSGAKNDYVLAMWLVAAVYFTARFARARDGNDALAAGAAVGLALFTKATAYLFAPWLLAAVILPRAAGLRRRAIPAALAAAACVLALNAPQYVRNHQLSGSVMGFDSAHGDGFFRWRNETFGWKQTASNLLRNLSDQLGGRSSAWNQNVYNWVVRLHRSLGIEVNDPATTWRWTVFEPPRNANHEANANNRWHLLILAIAGCVLAWRAARGRDRDLLLYLCGLAVAFTAFCFYLKWQPDLARLLLALFVAAAPLAGLVAESAPGALPRKPALLLQGLLCLFLLSVARLPALENWVRPLRGARTVFRVPRDYQYFADMTAWANRASYEETVRLLARGPCETIGIDIANFPLEYPLMALIRERRPGAQFVHTGVRNITLRYGQPVDRPPCAVVCFDCSGDGRREALYGGFPLRTAVGKFLVFQERPGSYFR